MPYFYDHLLAFFYMSGSVWYISVTRKRIEFKRYPKKGRKVKNSSKLKSGKLDPDKKSGKLPGVK